MEKKHLNPDGLLTPRGYSHIVTVASTLIGVHSLAVDGLLVEISDRGDTLTATH